MFECRVNTGRQDESTPRMIHSEHRIRRDITGAKLSGRLYAQAWAAS
jgi:hypothetical protein